MDEKTWLEDFLESYPAVGGVAKPISKRERALVTYAFNAATQLSTRTPALTAEQREAVQWAIDEAKTVSQMASGTQVHRFMDRAAALRTLLPAKEGM